MNTTSTTERLDPESVMHSQLGYKDSTKLTCLTQKERNFKKKSQRLQKFVRILNLLMHLEV
jgi:hypothetical protein